MDCCNSGEPQKKIVNIDPLQSPENQFICYCKEVTKGKIIEAIKNGAKTLNEIKEATGANTGNECKTKNPRKICCSGDIKLLLDYWIPKIGAKKPVKRG
ncbi:MAG: (2Fe-2S)-binding protein [Planctomycetes bacterium]|nr:(2Fe-2S)-binding protein [Planctomycetota bacterium]